MTAGIQVNAWTVMTAGIQVNAWIGHDCRYSGKRVDGA